MGSPSLTSISNILKEAYDCWPWNQYYDVEGAKEELIRRIKELAPVEKALYGIEEDVP